MLQRRLLRTLVPSNKTECDGHRELVGSSLIGTNRTGHIPFAVKGGGYCNAFSNMKIFARFQHDGIAKYLVALIVFWIGENQGSCVLVNR